MLQQFQQSNPCPSTGLTKGKCPGYVKDHIVPLCLIGTTGDVVTNIQWQTITDAKQKDRVERKQCAVVGCHHGGD